MRLSSSPILLHFGLILSLLLPIYLAPALSAQNQEPKPGQSLSGKQRATEVPPEVAEKRRLTSVYMQALRQHTYDNRDSALYYAEAQRQLQRSPPYDTLQLIMSYLWTADNLNIGGYFPEALAVMDELENDFFAHPPLDTLGPMYAALRLTRGSNYEERGLIDTALVLYKEALREFGEIDHPFRFESYRAIAGVYERRQLYDSAIHYLQQEISYGQQTGAKRYEYYGSVDMAKILEKTGRPAAALGLVERMLAMDRDFKVPTRMITSLMQSRCQLRYELGRDSVAEYCHAAYAQALTWATPQAAADAATTLTNYHRGLGNRDSVGYYIGRAWEISEEIEVDPDFAIRASNYAGHLLREGRRDQAYRVMERALERHRALPEINESGLGDLYTTLARTEYATGRLDSAEAHYDLGIAQLESRYRSRSEANVADATARFEVAEAGFALQQEQADRAVAEAASAQQRTLLLTILGAAVLLLLGGLLAYRRLNRDRAQIAAANEKLAVVVKEREMLLKEIHHRVKNNLQIISALLYKQAHNSTSEDVKVSLRDGQDRIQSMALVHQSLYQREELAHINARNFVAELVTHLQRSQSSEVSVDLRADDEELDMDQAIPVGLILNELITNALKYAFKGREAGNLSVTFGRTDGGEEYQLRVADDGRGLPAGFDWRKTKSLGMNLINGLTRQLGGRWTLEAGSSGGTVATVIFSVVRPT